jgi:hypothetical protein
MTIEESALEFCNVIRAHAGMPRALTLECGIRGHSESCVIANTVGGNCAVYSDNGGNVELFGIKHSWSLEAEQFIRLFDKGEFPHLELQR